MPRTTNGTLERQNLRLVKQVYPGLTSANLTALRELTRNLRLSISTGEILYLDGRWYITHAGLLRIAARRRCLGIRTVLQERQCDPVASRWVFKATVYTSGRSKGFVGYGDADPSNTSSLVRGALLRVAETRSIDRALRLAYGVGLCSLEELGSQPSSIPQPREGRTGCPPNGNGSAKGQPRLRDKLCLLIRKYELDPNLVKRYAADFCGTESLRDAGRGLVEAFVSTVAEEAVKDRAALVCKLNSYTQQEEVRL
jgi:hypothetical protein